MSDSRSAAEEVLLRQFWLDLNRYITQRAIGYIDIEGLTVPEPGDEQEPESVLDGIEDIPVYRVTAKEHLGLHTPLRKYYELTVDGYEELLLCPSVEAIGKTVMDLIELHHDSDDFDRSKIGMSVYLELLPPLFSLDMLRRIGSHIRENARMYFIPLTGLTAMLVVRRVVRKRGSK